MAYRPNAQRQVESWRVAAAQHAPEAVAARLQPGAEAPSAKQFGGRHAACFLSRAADRGALVATGAPHGFGTRDLAAQLKRKSVRRMEITIVVKVSIEGTEKRCKP